MAKTSIVMRERRRAHLVKKHATQRLALKKAVCNMQLSDEERATAQIQLQTLPRDASPTRQRNRCRITGRSRGVYRKFGLGRNILRLLAMRGDIPGLVKASW